MKHRLWEIDALRGVAIMMMVLYHFLWDVNLFLGTGIALTTGGWKVFQVLTATLFLGLVGVSTVLSDSKGIAPLRSYAKRSAKVGGCALLVSFGTWVVFPEAMVRFGILHLIAVAVLLSFVFRKWGYGQFFLGILCVVVGVGMPQEFFASPWLYVLAKGPVPVSALDYFPLLPWFGVVLLGRWVGIILRGKQRSPDLSNLLPIQLLTLMGRYSLAIYMLHQVVLFGIFWSVGWWFGF